MCSHLDERHKRNQPQQPPQQQNGSSLWDGTNDGNDDITLFESNHDDSDSGDNDNDVDFGSQHDDDNVGNAAATTRKVSLSPAGSFGNCQQTDAGDESRNENETVADGGGIRDSSESNNVGDTYADERGGGDSASGHRDSMDTSSSSSSTEDDVSQPTTGTGDASTNQSAASAASAASAVLEDDAANSSMSSWGSNLPRNVDACLGTIQFNRDVDLGRISNLSDIVLPILARVAKMLDDNVSALKASILSIIRQEEDSEDELMTALNEGVKSTLLSLSPDSMYSLNGSIRKVSL